MHNIIDNLKSIDNELKIIIKDNKLPTIIAVSKTFDSSIILPLLDYGHKHFGENKVQEAVDKWTDIKNNFNDIDGLLKLYDTPCKTVCLLIILVLGVLFNSFSNEVFG